MDQNTGEMYQCSKVLFDLIFFFLGSAHILNYENEKYYIHRT